MRAKKEKQTRTSRRASLRKMVASVTPRRAGSKTRTASPASRFAAKLTGGGRRRSVLAPRTVVVGTLCVVAAAALLMGRPSVKTWVADVDKSGQIERLEPLTNADAVDPAALTGAAAASPRASARTTSSSPASVEAPKATGPAPAAALEYAPNPASSPETTMKMISAPAPSVASQSASTASTSASEPEEPATPATIAGCVARNDDGFWLKDASGDGAPKSRSWKSGFLRKKSLTVALVDRGYTHRLATYVGQRVETTGLMVDREMRVKSLRVLGSCD